MEATITCKIDNLRGVDSITVGVGKCASKHHRPHSVWHFQQYSHTPCAGYPPNEVEDFHCISENWQNLTCTFMRSNNPIVPEYKLYYDFSITKPHTLHGVR